MDAPICHCFKYATLRTAWTDFNPGRRFWSCEKREVCWLKLFSLYFKKLKFVNLLLQCQFFAWKDPPMCARSTTIIPGLLRNRNNIETENAIMKRKLFKLKCYLFVCVVVIFWLMMKWILYFGWCCNEDYVDCNLIIKQVLPME